MKVPVATARHLPPGEVTLSAYDLHRTTSSHQRAETAPDAQKQGTTVSATKPAAKATTPSASVPKDPKRGPTPSGRVTPANPAYAETETAMLADLQKAIDAALSIPIPNVETITGAKKEVHSKRVETIVAEDKISAGITLL